MTGRGSARLIGWAMAGGASAALLSGAALALTLTRKPETEPLFLTMDPAQPANLSVAALADPAPAVVDEAPDIPEPAPLAEKLPDMFQTEELPGMVRAPALRAPSPDRPVQADLSLPDPMQDPEPKQEPEAKPKRDLKPTPQPKPKPKKVEAAPREQMSASAGASAPKAGRTATGGKKTSPAAYAKAVMKKVRATKKKSGAGRGKVVVGFTIGSNGRLAGVSILQSSGNAGLDRVATDHILRSAPFPAPPQGVGTSYSFEFIGN